jgi:hypothetical protein
MRRYTRAHRKYRLLHDANYLVRRRAYFLDNKDKGLLNRIRLVAEIRHCKVTAAVWAGWAALLTLQRLMSL